jgi:hypothetical protein
MANGMLYQLTVGGFDEAYGDDAKKFFDSFELIDQSR